MAQAVGGLSLTAETRFRSQANPCEIYGGLTVGQVSVQVLRCYPLSIIPPVFRTIFILILLLSDGQVLAALGNLQTNPCVF